MQWLGWGSRTISIDVFGRALTTQRYVDASEEQSFAAVEKVRGGHTIGRSANLAKTKDFCGATRRNRTGDLLITNQSLYQLS